MIRKRTRARHEMTDQRRQTDFAAFLHPGQRCPQTSVHATTESAVTDGYNHGIRLAAVVAPSSQAASRSAGFRSPTKVSGSRKRRHRKPVAIDSTARTAPVVSLPPCTYKAYGLPTVASKIGWCTQSQKCAEPWAQGHHVP